MFRLTRTLEALRNAALVALLAIGAALVAAPLAAGSTSISRHGSLTSRTTSSIDRGGSMLGTTARPHCFAEATATRCHRACSDACPAARAGTTVRAVTTG